MAKNVQMYKEDFQKIKRAIVKNKIDQLGELIKKDGKKIIDINTKDEYGDPLFFHLLDAKNNKINLEMIKLFIEFNADFRIKNSEGETLLNKIIATKNIAAIRTILKCFKLSLVDNENSNGELPLHIAVKTGSKYMTKLLVKYKADPNIKYKNGNTLLGQEIITGNNNMASLLIKLKADLNMKNDNDETPLHLAVKHGRLSIIKSLLISDGKANLYLTDGYGKIPLDYAFEGKKLHIIEYLIRGGMQVDHPDQLGKTMLIKAVGVKNDKPYDHTMVSQLISLEANYNVLNEKGESIIKKIIKNNDLKSLELIFNLSLFNQTNLKKEIIDKEGEAWARIAVQNKNHKISEFLLKNGILTPSCLSYNNQVTQDVSKQQHQAEQKHESLKKKRKEKKKDKENLEKHQEKIKDHEEYKYIDADSEDESSSNSDNEKEQLYGSNNVRVNRTVLPQENDSKTKQPLHNKLTVTPFTLDYSNVVTENLSGIITCRKQQVSIDDEEQSYLSAVDEHMEPPEDNIRDAWKGSAASNSSSSFYNLPRLNSGGSQSSPTDEELISPPIDGISGRESSFSDLDGC